MYRLVVAPKARDEIEGFLEWLTNYNEKTAEEFRLDLERAVNNQILQSPNAGLISSSQEALFALISIQFHVVQAIGLCMKLMKRGSW